MIENSWHEECGIVGVYNGPQSRDVALMALHALQHRGQESSGIAVADGTTVRAYKRLGLVSELASKLKGRTEFAGHIAIGHNRYSTTGGNLILNAQPILIDYKKGQLAVAHNGNLINARFIRSEMEKNGSIFQSTSDSEVILHLVARSISATVPEMVQDSLRLVKGAYSVVLCNERQLIAARDPLGVRPLSVGKLGEGYIVASETCAFDLVGAEYIRDVEPGEILIFDQEGMRSLWIDRAGKRAQCIFEFIYFSRPDSQIFNKAVDKIRRKLGAQLAQEAPAPGGDLVMAVPDSSNTAALGYAHTTGIPFELGLIRNHYVGRTFIDPVQTDRDLKVRLKFNPVRGVIKDKRVVLVEDSIVRGTTLRQLAGLVREAGAAEIHVRVSSPPILNPCFYGMDFPSREELIASNKSVEEIRRFLKVDSLAYLSLAGLRACVPSGQSPDDFCYACFSGKYPYPVEKDVKKEMFGRGQQYTE
jgi:amidophosphoribosyltransferase